MGSLVISIGYASIMRDLCQIAFLVSPSGMAEIPRLEPGIVNL
jgi:hypothetical protein